MKLLQLLKAERDTHYWHSGYFIRIFKEEYGTGWQVFRDDKFTYRNGQFVDLISRGDNPVKSPTSGGSA